MLKIRWPSKESPELFEFDDYEKARKWEEEKLEEYKKINSVKNEDKDNSFIAFKHHLQEIIDSQCPKCPNEDHERKFCRCEGRNIQIAKRRRDRGESPWEEKCDERV